MTRQQDVRIGLIGAGKMGQALLTGLRAHGVPRHALCASETSPQTRTTIRRRFRIKTINDSLQVARQSNVVILAVKPQQFPAVIASLEAGVTRRHLVISIAAGIRLRWLEARLPGVPIIRAMPNLPATVGCGFSAIALGRRATARHRAIALAIFRAVGQVVDLPERSFDAITAVSGSGPAYLFFLVQAWEEAARALGLPRLLAGRAIRQTLEGSLRLWQASHGSAQTLIGQVASKGGTTEAALRVLAKRRVAARFTEALRAAARRSRELSWS